MTYFLKLFFHSVTFILIIFLIYRRKFCDGHIVLVFKLWCNLIVIFMFDLSTLNLSTEKNFTINPFLCPQTVYAVKRHWNWNSYPLNWMRKREKKKNSMFDIHEESFPPQITSKYLVWLSHDFLLPYIIVEKYFIISITFLFNVYFICFIGD